MADVMITNMGRTEGKRYMISDAAKLVDVESHVLRYWEEELDIEIPRNEMGHRYYTDYYINAFKKIKELKDQGFLLKAIKIALPEIMEGNDVDGVRTIKEEVRYNQVEGVATEHQAVSKKDNENKEAVNQIISNEALREHTDIEEASKNITVSKAAEVSVVDEQISKASKMEQFQMILGNIVTSALKENNSELTNQVSKNVSNSVIKEMDYLLRLKEEREEERFKKFDEMVRGLQKDNKLAAIKNGEKKRKFFGRK